MTPRPTRTVRSALLKKGFIEEAFGDHKRLRLCADGEETHIHTHHTGRLRCRTVDSHGARECDGYILGRMAKQLRISRAQLNDLIDCRLGAEAYVKILRDLGAL